MEVALSIGVGLGLSAACGFRVFVPLLVMNIAARSDWLTLGDRFGWIASDPALVVFGVATLLEIGAYYIPWIDNLLDTVATPAAIVAGVIATASVVTDLSPLLQWSLAIIAGGGVAGTVQALTVGTRGASTVMTAGFGNPLISTLEGGSSIVLSLLSIVAPLVAVLVVVGMLLFIGRRMRRHRAVSALQ